MMTTSTANDTSRPSIYEVSYIKGQYMDNTIPAKINVGAGTLIEAYQCAVEYLRSHISSDGYRIVSITEMLSVVALSSGIYNEAYQKLEYGMANIRHRMDQDTETLRSITGEKKIFGKQDKRSKN